jgi:RNA polymerase sigma-70 factor, ECF subfamily
MDEGQAIEHLKRGDIRGLEALVRLHQVRAVRTAYLITRELALAQDIVQAAFVRAYERIGQLDPHRPFGAWFVTIVLHDAMKAAARRSRFESLDDHVSQVHADFVDGQPGPEAAWEHAETAEEVWAALGRLTPEQRAAVVARYFLGLTEAEMTAALALPASTVKWRLHAARRRLRVLLTPVLSNE